MHMGKRIPLEVRFWSKVIKTTNDDCWIWTGRHYYANKSVCKNGHSLSGENLYIKPNSTWRNCRTCQKKYNEKSERKKRERNSDFCGTSLEGRN